MKASGDPEWFEYRAVVPLTGREPLLARLRARLRMRGGWSRITLQGQSGAGLSRLLDEVASIMAEGGAPPALIVRASGRPDRSMGALRKAILAAFPHERDPLALERLLRSSLPLDVDEVGALAAWLVGGEAVACVAQPVPRHVRRLLGFLLQGRPILVDRIESFDEATREVLAPSASGLGPVVLATTQTRAAADPAAGEEVWEVDGLTRSQTELLLRRWLRHPATAKRLAAVLHAPTDGLPGRVVEAVRTLGRARMLVREARGIVLKGSPPSWPDGRRDPNAFLAGALRDATARRVLELAAALPGHAPLAFIAEAAGVKAPLVTALCHEAAHARGERGSETLFASEPDRLRFLAEIPAARLSRIHLRIAEAADRDARLRQSILSALLASLHRHAAGVGLPEAIADCLARVLAESPPAHQVRPLVLDVIERALEILVAAPRPPERVLARGLRLIEAAGRHEAAAALLAAVGGRLLPEGPAGWTLVARAGDLAGDRSAALDLLERRLERSTAPDEGDLSFDAWALVGSWRRAARDLEGARRAWGRAARYMPEFDLHRMATWHLGLAEVALAQKRRGIAAAHLRRGANLLRALGQLLPAGTALLQLGRIEVERGRAWRGIGTLTRAAHLHNVLAQAQGEAEAMFLVGCTYARCQAYELATRHLDIALSVVEAADLRDVRAPLHLAAARAWRGRGDLERERQHAARGVQHAGAALARLEAGAAMALADLRAGAAGAEFLLERSESDLRASGLDAEADQALALLGEAKIQEGRFAEAAGLLPESAAAPALRLARARLQVARGREQEAMKSLDELSCDMSLPADQRAAAYVLLAQAACQLGRMRDVRRAGVAAAALLEVTHRSRANDARLHLLLARTFARAGESGRAAGHRRLARRAMRVLVRAAVDAEEGRRLVRAHWRADPGVPAPAIRVPQPTTV